MNIDLILSALQYTFMQRALLVGIMIAVSSSFLGIFLVLRRYSMIGDGLAHVSFATVAFALLLQQSPLLISIPIVILASFLILKLSEENRIGGDAAIGLVASFSVALGVFVSSLAKGFNVDLFSYLFGSILVIGQNDVIFSIFLSITVIGVILFYYQDLFALTYDEEYAVVMGKKPKKLSRILAVLTSITIVLGIRVVGTMLISSLIIFPTVTALQLNRGFKQTIALAIIISVSAVVLGIFASFAYDLPTGSTIVLVNGLFFGLSFLTRIIKGGN
ncbi:MAG: metal ABC transporter permease [Erysipelothrix sp.]|nr:metal ABC transporter permease [Erysipelothrix sp.]